jgi:predicted DNA-binding transcriptional regulator AlpA
MGKKVIPEADRNGGAIAREARVLQFPPRGLSRIDAARYVGVSPSLFDQMVKDGRMPKPIRINSRVVWDRQQIDEAFERLSGSENNPWDVDAAA